MLESLCGSTFHGSFGLVGEFGFTNTVVYHIGQKIKFVALFELSTWQSVQSPLLV